MQLQVDCTLFDILAAQWMWFNFSSQKPQSLNLAIANDINNAEEISERSEIQIMPSAPSSEALNELNTYFKKNLDGSARREWTQVPTSLARLTRGDILMDT